MKHLHGGEEELLLAIDMGLSSPALHAWLNLESSAASAAGRAQRKKVRGGEAGLKIPQGPGWLVCGTGEGTELVRVTLNISSVFGFSISHSALHQNIKSPVAALALTLQILSFHC